ncbi:MAG: hypothetical protein U9N49_12245 [Campylobacterota bacterium]|nr:hypothetical protein [Campylobacterota bacterium]
MWKQKLTTGFFPDELKILDSRFKTPVVAIDERWDKHPTLQDIDVIAFDNNEIPLITPNIIAIHLSISDKSLNNAIELFDKIKLHIKQYKKEEKLPEKRTEIMLLRSKLICEYLEEIQTSIIFSISAIETFTNMSIPNDFIYTKNEAKHTLSYNKQQIEKNIPLKEKISKILQNIYNCTGLEEEKFWSNFCSLIKIRDSLIHQKTIDDTFYNENFYTKKIFDKINTIKLLIGFFQKNLDQNNNLKNVDFWPLLKGENIIFNFVEANNNLEPDIGQRPVAKTSKKVDK